MGTQLTRRQLLHAVGMGAGALALQRVPAFAAEATALAIAGDPLGPGYWVLGSDGSVRASGTARSLGSAGPLSGAADLLADPRGRGYWRVKRSGAASPAGSATLRVEAAGRRDSRVVAAAAQPDGQGLWRVTEEGQVLAAGTAPRLGAPPSSAPITAMASHPEAPGYWVLSRAGQIFGFGAARDLGQPGGRGWVGIAAHPGGDGYWALNRDGTVAGYGTSGHYGNGGGDAAFTGIAGCADGQGYWLLRRDGRVVPFGSAAAGIMTTEPPPEPTLTTTAAGIVVASSIARRVRGLVEHAADDGIKLGGWGYRAYSRQVELRRQNCGPRYYDVYVKPSSECSPMTARPGLSLHERGLAIDFYRRLSGGAAGEVAGTRAFRWLQRNAKTYGLYNLPSEPWHWSTTGG